jgi:hypothetical protein
MAKGVMEMKGDGKVMLLNALVTSSRVPMTLRTRPISVEEVRVLITTREIVSFIGHEATAQLLTTLFNTSIPANRGMYDPKPGEVAIVVRLKKRLEKPEDVKNVKPEDIEFILVEYLR